MNEIRLKAICDLTKDRNYWRERADAAEVELVGQEPVIGAAVIATTAFRLRDQEGLNLALRALMSAVAKLPKPAAAAVLALGLMAAPALASTATLTVTATVVAPPTEPKVVCTQTGNVRVCEVIH